MPQAPLSQWTTAQPSQPQTFVQQAAVSQWAPQQHQPLPPQQNSKLQTFVPQAPISRGPVQPQYTAQPHYTGQQPSYSAPPQAQHTYRQPAYSTPPQARYAASQSQYAALPQQPQYIAPQQYSAPQQPQYTPSHPQGRSQFQTDVVIPAMPNYQAPQPQGNSKQSHTPGQAPPAPIHQAHQPAPSNSMVSYQGQPQAHAPEATTVYNATPHTVMAFPSAPVTHPNPSQPQPAPAPHNQQSVAQPAPTPTPQFLYFDPNNANDAAQKYEQFLKAQATSDPYGGVKSAPGSKTSKSTPSQAQAKSGASQSTQNGGPSRANSAGQSTQNTTSSQPSYSNILAASSQASWNLNPQQQRPPKPQAQTPSVSQISQKRRVHGTATGVKISRQADASFAMERKFCGAHRRQR